jgi:hypothetical protein
MACRQDREHSKGARRAYLNRPRYRDCNANLIHMTYIEHQDKTRSQAWGLFNHGESPNLVFGLFNFSLTRFKIFEFTLND